MDTWLGENSMDTFLFVGSNPSNASESDVAFHEGTKSSQLLTEWASNLNGMKMHINVLNEKTEGNRPLKKSEIKANLPQLAETVKLINATKVIAVGKTAAEALRAIGVEHYELPHPSGCNRQLNDKAFVEAKVKGLVEYCSQPTLNKS